MRFHETSVWFLLLLGLVPLIWWRWLAVRSRPAMRFSSVTTLLGIRPAMGVRARVLLPALRSLAFVLLVLALARPQKGNEQTRIFSEGIAIQMLVDRSGSMRAMDFTLDGKPVDRLHAVRKVVRDFVMGGDGMRGRDNDLIGMIAFARYADSKCPLTLDHGFLTESLGQIEIVKTQSEDGTAIGDAIALGVERLRSLETERHLQHASRIKSKIMILLTDGENNAGKIDPAKAAEMAAAFGIRIYTIGAGTEGLAPVPAVNPFTGQEEMRQMQVSIDEESLRAIAKATGGHYFRATDTDSLRRIYAEIDKLEKTKTEEKRYLQYKELATESIQLGRFRLPPLLLCAFIVLAIEIVLANTRFRKIP
jgi:Ca-activated chloride channel homolog